MLHIKDKISVEEVPPTIIDIFYFISTKYMNTLLKKIKDYHKMQILQNVSLNSVNF